MGGLTMIATGALVTLAHVLPRTFTAVTPFCSRTERHRLAAVLPLRIRMRRHAGTTGVAAPRAHCP